MQQRQEADSVANQQTLNQAERLIESNARAIEANSNNFAAMQQRQEQAEQELRASIDDVVEMISTLGQQADQQNRQTAEQQANTNQLLQQLVAQKAETDQRFNTLLADTRADRQRAQERDAAHAAEHRAFQQIIQTMLAEINRLWQRLAG